MAVFKKVDNGEITFGIHNGKKWSELPSHYLEFLKSEKCYIREEFKEIAKKELAQRDICDGQETLFNEPV